MGWALRSGRALAIAGLLLLLVYALGTLLDGLGRALLGSPIPIVRDAAHPFVALALSCCFPYGLVSRVNIVVTLLDPLLPPRPRTWLAVFGWAITLFVIGCFAYQFFRHAVELMEAGETTAEFGIPLAPFWFGVAANFAFATVLHFTTFKTWVARGGAEAHHA